MPEGTLVQMKRDKKDTRSIILIGGIKGFIRVFLRWGALLCKYLPIACLTLGILRILYVYVSHAVFHVTLNGMEKIGVTSPFVLTRVSCGGVMSV